MANEIKDWRQPGCSVAIQIGDLSQRETFSHEINEIRGEGGGLNADYQTVEAVAIVANGLGKIGLTYGIDFVWKTAENGEVSFDFRDPIVRQRAEAMFHRARTNMRRLPRV